MDFTILKTGLEEIAALRALFLQENNFQFVHNKCHENGWADCYVFLIDGIKVGYGAVWGADRREDRDSVFEFFVTRPYRTLSDRIFPSFLGLTGVLFIESQSNDLLLSTLLYRHASNITAEAILFKDHFVSSLAVPGAIFRKKRLEDNIGQDTGNYVLELEGGPVASGGFLLNYNMPYADVYMEVAEPFQGRGLGSLMVQGLKKEIYKMGRVPAARCNINNLASRATLEKAGFTVCGALLKGEVKLNS